MSDLDAEHERDAERIQYYVDMAMHYRNLAITLGATPEQMMNSYDRWLCSDWSQLHAAENPFAYELGELRDAWAIIEAIDELHHHDGIGTCNACDLSWPCATRQLTASTLGWTSQ